MLLGAIPALSYDLSHRLYDSYVQFSSAAVFDDVGVVIPSCCRSCRCLAHPAFPRFTSAMLLSSGTRCAYTAALLFWTSLSLCSAAYVQENTTNVPGYKLRSGVSSVPVPLRVAPDQGWLGIDGQWNTFSLRLGSKQTVAQVLPSTASQQIWAVNRKGCTYQSGNQSNAVEKFSQDCDKSRGYVFSPDESSTWTSQGFYSLWVGGNFGLNARGDYGYDNVGLGIPGEDGPTVENTTIGTLINTNFWVGHFGLHPKPTNFSKDMAAVPPVPSYMTRLFEQGNIPSLSFGYTAGVQYRKLSDIHLRCSVADLCRRPAIPWKLDTRWL